MRTLLAVLIAKEEGYGVPGKIPTRRNNPGDLRHSPHSEHPGGPDHKEDIGTIDTPQHGWDDLERQLVLYQDRGMTLKEAIYTFAPIKDGNNPALYLDHIIQGFQEHGWMGVTPEMPLSYLLKVTVPTT